MGLFEGLGMLWIYTLLDMQCSPYMMILISRQQQSKMQNKKRGEHTWSWAYWHTISRPVLLLLSSDIWSFFLYKCCDHKLFTPWFVLQTVSVLCCRWMDSERAEEFHRIVSPLLRPVLWMKVLMDQHYSDMGCHQFGLMNPEMSTTSRTLRKWREKCFIGRMLDFCVWVYVKSVFL